MSSSLLPSNGGVGWSALANNAISAPQFNGFRLSLTSGTPVTTSDVTGATGIYFTPDTSDRISLYDGVANWSVYSFAETVIPLGTLTSGANYDVFISASTAGAITYFLYGWAGSTTRVSNLVRQNGVYVNYFNSTQRYVGTIRTTNPSFSRS
jgi:3D (Asp-Asp-Asp) domain-containing protein